MNLKTLDSKTRGLRGQLRVDYRQCLHKLGPNTSGFHSQENGQEFKIRAGGKAPGLRLNYFVLGQLGFEEGGCYVEVRASVFISNARISIFCPTSLIGDFNVPTQASSPQLE